MIKDEIVKKEIIFNSECSHGKYHVAFGVDSGFVKAAVVTIASFLKNNNGCDFNFYILTSEIKPDDLKELNKFSHSGVKITVIYINNNVFDNYQVKENLPKSMYYRLLIPYVLKDIADKVLYIDADTLCLSRIDDLFESCLDNYIIAAVEDSGEAAVDAKLSGLFSDGRYFNSGVILININRWLEKDIFSLFNQVIHRSDYKYPDQDVLNIILTDNVLFLDKKYNTFYNNGNYDKDNVSILHFVGSPKPWMSWCKNNQLYIDYLKLTPWGEKSVDMPKNYKQCKLLSAKLCNEREYIKSTYWYMKYLIYKIMKIK